MLSVVMRDNVQESKAVCDRICSMLRTRFIDYGYNGTWTAVLFKRTGGLMEERVQYLRPAYKGKGLLYYVRPGDRDTGWQVSVAPPSHIAPSSVDRKENYEKNLATGKLATEKEPEQPQPEEKATEELTLNVGQMYQATITDHLEHGLNLEVDAKTGEYHGYINLADLSPTYDVKELLKYPVGKTIRVIISDIDEGKKRITCSIRTEGIAGTTHNRDLFTGIPNKDGSLSLEGFTKDINRVYKVLEWFAVLSADHYPNPIPHEKAMEWLIENLKHEYKVEVVEKRSASSIFASMCGGMEPLMNRADEPRGYSITEFGWSEIGGKEKWLEQVSPGKPPEQPTDDESAELLPPLPDHVANLPPEEPKPEPEKIYAELANPIRTKEEASVCLDNVMDFLSKCVRRNTIQDQMTQLNREAVELDAWLDKNKHLRVAAANMLKKDASSQ